MPCLWCNKYIHLQELGKGLSHKGPSQITYSNPLPWQGHLSLEQVAQSHIQHNAEHFK